MLNLILAVSLSAFAGDPSTGTAKPAAGGEDSKILYSLGYFVGLRLAPNLAPFGLQGADFTQFSAGLKDSLTGSKPKVDVNAYGPKIEELAQKRASKKSAVHRAKGKVFWEKLSKEKGAEVSPTGLIFIPLKEGTGPRPASTDTVRAHYEGKLIDGTKFDSSYDRNEPYTTGLSGGIIRCWTEGIPKLKVGGKARLICPADIAYSDEDKGPLIKGGMTLDFVVELVEIVK